jgi:eukaryotic-like serine/threonine-protein kinase
MTDVRDQLEAVVGDAYHIERELPPGGMSRLFLATERSLDRRVVIKLLPPEYASEASAARFQREITLTAHLLHPHILPILTAGSKGGLLYYVMPYVEGESLRQRLERDRRLPIAVALQILGDVADALARAHRAGIVHRDIKPENILLQEEYALLADFGVARALHEATGSTRLTDTGMGLGTPGYMAPEQLAGDRNVDARADVYALAVVGYEMLAGVAPFTGSTPQAVASAHFTSPPKPLEQVRSEVPSAVSDAIGQALAKDPDRRFPTAAAFRAALAGDRQVARSRATPFGRWVVNVAAIVIVAAIATAGWLHRRAGTATAAREPVRLAVLPFDNVGDSANSYFADGLSEEITDRIARVPGVNVIGRTSALQYRASGKTAPEFGRTLGVQYVLDGTVRWASASNGGKRVRITPALIRVSDGTQVWDEPYDGVPADVFELQSDVAERVAQSLQGTLLPGQRQALRTAPTEDLEAYRLYLLGREEWRKRTPEGLARATAYFQQAIDDDPKYARAYAGLADAYGLYWEYGIRTLPHDTVFARATAAASRALAIDSTIAEGHAALGNLQMSRWDWPDAERELRRAIELDPNYTSAHQWYAEYLMMHGRIDEALGEASTAFRLDPLAGIVADAYGLALSAKGRTGEATAVYRAAIARDSTLSYLRRGLCLMYVYAGRPDDALALLTAVHDTSSLDRDFVLAGAQPAARRRAIARMHLGMLGTFEYTEATGFVMLGEPDSAFAAADRALAAHDENLGYMNAEPMWAPLRADPRFAAVMRRMGLSP